MKPSPALIRGTPPLSSLRRQPVGRFVCTVCGEPDEFLSLYREHDEHDRPTRALILLGGGDEHSRCQEELEAHPRLYSEEQGQPGVFPRLCGSCTKRKRASCTDPRAKANGGDGLKVGLSTVFHGVVMCHRGGCERPIATALDCEGQELPGETGEIT